MVSEGIYFSVSSTYVPKVLVKVVNKVPIKRTTTNIRKRKIDDIQVYDSDSDESLAIPILTPQLKTAAKIQRKGKTAKKTVKKTTEKTTEKAEKTMEEQDKWDELLVNFVMENPILYNFYLNNNKSAGMKAELWRNITDVHNKGKFHKCCSKFYSNYWG